MPEISVSSTLKGSTASSSTFQLDKVFFAKKQFFVDCAMLNCFSFVYLLLCSSLCAIIWEGVVKVYSSELRAIFFPYNFGKNFFWNKNGLNEFFWNMTICLMGNQAQCLTEFLLQL